MYLSNYPEVIAWGAVIFYSLYFAPAFKAEKMRHHNANAIFMLNLLLGWTFVGWAVAMVWAYTKSDRVSTDNVQEEAYLVSVCLMPVLLIAYGLQLYRLIFVYGIDWYWKLLGVVVFGPVGLVLIVIVLWTCTPLGRTIEKFFSEKKKVVE